MSALTLQGLQPWFRSQVEYGLAWLDYYQVRYSVTSAYRSHAQQARLYAQRAANPYPVAAPGRSAHNYGLAVDVAGDRPGDDAAVSYVFRALGFRQPPRDPVHFEYPGWQQLAGR